MNPSRRTQTGFGVLVWSVVAAPLAELPAQPGWTVDPLRLLVVGGFLLIGPGLAVTALLELADQLLAWVVTVGTSLAVLVLCAQAALYANWWSPSGVVWIIAVLTFVLACFVVAWSPEPCDC